jgi:hypothetical protein
MYYLLEEDTVILIGRGMERSSTFVNVVTAADETSKEADKHHIYDDVHGPGAGCTLSCDSPGRPAIVAFSPKKATSPAQS